MPPITESTSADTQRFSKPPRVRFRSKVTVRSSPTSPPRLRIFLDDEELCARAEAVANAMNFHGHLRETGTKCALKHTRGAFTIYTRRPESMSIERTGKPHAAHQVLSVGEIRCHLNEVVRVLRTTQDVEYNSVMSGLYPKDFIYGSVVHAVPSAMDNELTLSNLLAQEEASRTPRVAVKTATFVHSRCFHLTSSGVSWRVHDTAVNQQARRVDPVFVLKSSRSHLQ